MYRGEVTPVRLHTHTGNLFSIPVVALQQRAMASPTSASWAHVARFVLTRLAPASAIIGASMEAFMCKTGFYDVATRKERERREARIAAAEKRLGGWTATGSQGEVR